MRPHPLGRDGRTGIIHYSLSKHAYIDWPLCGTPYLDLYRVDPSRMVTCVECLGCAVKYGWDNNVLR